MTGVELFTHPTCRGCQEALQALRGLERDGKVELMLTSLGTPQGRRRAEQMGVSCVPTVRVAEQFRELNGDADLQALLAELR